MTKVRRGLTTRWSIVAAVAMISVVAFAVVGGAGLAGNDRGKHGARGSQSCAFGIGQYQYGIGQYQYSVARQTGIGQYQYKAGCGRLGSGLVLFCHKGRSTKTAVDGSKKLRKHLRHGDQLGQCASRPGQGKGGERGRGEKDEHGKKGEHAEGGERGDDGGDDDDDHKKVGVSNTTIGGGASLNGDPSNGGNGGKKGRR